MTRGSPSRPPRGGERDRTGGDDDRAVREKLRDLTRKPKPPPRLGVAAARGEDRANFDKPPLRILTTTLWEYPSQHYGPRGAVQGDPNYVGATPSWIIWQLLQRYTREKDLVVDPMCGSGTTLDVARDLGRRALGYDLRPTRPDIFRADARRIPVEDRKADFVFIDPPYSTHVEYSDDPRCIGKLSAGGRGADAENGAEYYAAMEQVIAEMYRVLRPGGHAALYVSDSFEKPSPSSGETGFMPIGFELFALLRRKFEPVDTVCVVRHNEKLSRGNWHKAAEEGNFFLRGFNYLFIMRRAAEGTGRGRGNKPAPARPQER